MNLPIPILTAAAIAALIATPSAFASDSGEAVHSLLESYEKSFGHPATGLLYHNRLDSPRGLAALSSPEEIARGEVDGKPMPHGYGSGIQDVALENGQLLFALCDAHERTGEKWIADRARALFASLKVLARVSPEPGFVPRGPHPDGRSYYRDPSRDQVTAYIEALWRYGRSPLATNADKAFIAGTIGKIATRMERDDWRIMIEDGSRQAHVGWGWKQFTSIGSITLLSVLAQTFDATGDPHWRELYEQFSAERDGERWNRWLHPDAVKNWRPLTLYANQFCQALTALRRLEKNPDRKAQLAELERRLATRMLESNVFDPIRWRRLDWAGDRNEAETQALIAPLGLDLKKPMSVLELYDSYDRQVWDRPGSRAHSVMGKLCYGLATVALHAALLSDDPKLREQAQPTVRRMVAEFSQHQQDYNGGENFNRTVILGLLALEGKPAAKPTASQPRELPILRNLGCGPAMDVALEGDRMYVIGRGKLHVADATDPAKPVLLGGLSGLGNTRQIVVKDGMVYVGSREDRLFVIDAREAAKPRLLDHYDTIEFATGLALAGDVLFVALRQYGVELVDVSDPTKPLFLSVVRTGEAQSVAYQDGFLYAGVWGSSEVVVADVRNPREPRIVSRTPLDGYGDGVDVRDGFLYAATGHHSREPHRKPEDPGYGRGHGLEILSLKDPAKPAFISRVKFPPLYAIGNDMWSVTVANGHAFVADTHNGVFIVDVRNPAKPEIVGRRQLPTSKGKDKPAYFGGIEVGRDHVYGAGGWTDLHVIPAPGLAVPVTPQTGAPPKIPPRRPNGDKGVTAYRPEGQVHAAAVAGEQVVAACGSAGVHVVDLAHGLKPLSDTPTEDFATDVSVLGHTVYVAEGAGGMSIWSLTNDGKLEPKGRYRVRGRRVRYLTVPAPGRFALAQVGASTLHIVDVSDPQKPRLALEDNQFGLLYGHQVLDGLADGRHAAAYWHVSGIHWYDLGVDPPRREPQLATGRVSMLDGLALHRGQLLSPRRGGYILLDRSETRPLDELPIHRVEGTYFRGRPTVAGDRLHVANRTTGDIVVLDIRSPEKPRLLERFTTRGNPGAVTLTPRGLLIPDGNGGLLLRRETGSRR